MAVPYDYKSVMHYSATAFGAPSGSVTITRKDGSQDLGNRVGLSPLDIKQAKLLYCGAVQPGTSPTTPTPTQAPAGRWSIGVMRS